MLSAIDERDRPYAVIALRWLSCAKRPLRLEELAEACCINPEGTPSIDLDHRVDPRGIPAVLSSLVRVYDAIPPAILGENGTTRQANADDVLVTHVQLAHFSVKEYLNSDSVVNSSNSCFHLSEAASHLSIAQSCAAYLREFVVSYDREDWAPWVLLYARRYFEVHQRAAELQGLPTSCLWVHLDILQSRAAKQFYFSSADLSSLYLASAFGLDLTCQAIGNAEINRVEGLQEEAATPLIAAVVGGFESTVKVLLSMGADVNIVTHGYGTALQAASYGGREQIVK